MRGGTGERGGGTIRNLKLPVFGRMTKKKKVVRNFGELVDIFLGWTCEIQPFPEES